MKTSPAGKNPAGHLVASRSHSSLTLKKIYIKQIRAGSKTVEGRILKGAVTRLAVGTTVRFYYYSNARDDVTCKIASIHRYPTFKAMLEDRGFKNCIPTAPSLEAAIQAYASIPGYPEKESRFGVVALTLSREI